MWGSYWEKGKWGFACCKQLVRNSYCTGAAGRLAKEDMERSVPIKPSSSLSTSTTASTNAIDTNHEQSSSLKEENGLASSSQQATQQPQQQTRSDEEDDGTFKGIQFGSPNSQKLKRGHETQGSSSSEEDEDPSISRKQARALRREKKQKKTVDSAQKNAK